MHSLKTTFKHYFVSFFILLSGLIYNVSIAQSPNLFNYQAVIRNAQANIVADLPVKMRLSILQGNVDGNSVFTELHSPKTNAQGIVSIQIGGGTLESGDFKSIDWSNGPYFLKTEVDPANGSSFSIAGTTQLLSVPYSKYADISGGVSHLMMDTVKSNLAIGNKLFNNSLVGRGNLAIGVGALKNLSSTGFTNIAIGNDAGNSMKAGGYNTFVGDNAGQGNSNGFFNSYYGFRAGQYRRSGMQSNMNSVFGSIAGSLDTMGIFFGNSIFGYQAGRYVRNSRNIVIGYNAGGTTTFGSNNIIIGPNVSPTGASAQVLQNNKLMIDVDSTNTPLIYGEFDQNQVVINGDLTVTGKMKGPLSKKVVYGSNIGDTLRIAVDTEILYTYDGAWNPVLILPETPPMSRIGSTLMLVCGSSFSFIVVTKNSDLSANLMLNTGDYVLFLNDGTKWRRIAGKL